MQDLVFVIVMTMLFTANIIQGKIQQDTCDKNADFVLNWHDSKGWRFISVALSSKASRPRLEGHGQCRCDPLLSSGMMLIFRWHINMFSSFS